MSTPADANPALARTTRSSSRVKAAAAAPAAPVATTKPKSKTAKPKSASVKPASKSKKTTKKRARDVSDNEDDATTSKKAKTDDDNNMLKEDDDEADDEPKKMVTVLKRGAAAVDAMSGRVGTHQVYADPEDVYDARLNQTEISGNKNKFYILQLQHPIGNSSSCQLFTRWGRVGESGAYQTKGPWNSATAVNEFKKQFKAKTGTEWASRKGAAAKKGKYVWLEPADDDEPDSSGAKGDKTGNGKQEEEEIPDSVLAPELQSLCNLIFSTKIMEATLESMQYDANKLPLGKLAKSTILGGFAALKKIAEVIEKPTGDLATSLGGHNAACQQLSNEYYSVIPHVFGRRIPTNINNIQLLKQQLELVDALGDMDFAQSIISSSIVKDEHGHPLNPLDAHFRSLNLTTMEPVKHKSYEFDVLEAYARDTHGATHSHYKAKVLNAFRVERQNETDAWTKAGHDGLADGEKLLLWHGSRTTNFAGILSQGLRIAPPEAPVTGYMFGKGVYFADMMSKSANYCYSHLSDSVGLLLLCEVAARPFHEETNANYNADQACKDNKKLCTKGIGMTQPVKWKDAGEALSNPALTGCHMPDGPGQLVSPPGAYLQYNEYIVYNTSQIRVRYLLMVEMK